MSSATIAALPAEDANVVIVPMLTTSRAVDLYLGDLHRRGYSSRTTDTYRRILDKFTDTIRDDADVTDIRPDDCRRFLDAWNRRAQGTRAHTYSVLNAFLKWLYGQQRIKRNPLDHVPRPRRIPAEDLDVTTVANDDVPKLLAACEGWTEKLAVSLAVYTGARRHALAVTRFRDFDQVRGRLRFREKGAKTIWKPIPDELLITLNAAVAGGVYASPDDYLIPAEGPLSRGGVRDDRVIWRVIKRVADRAGIEAHVHALRAAFATFYLEQHAGDVEALRILMGHRSIATTQSYLRKLDQQVAMERVRGLAWVGNTDGHENPESAVERFADSAGVGAGGFEPPSPDSSALERPGTEHLADELLDAAIRAPSEVVEPDDFVTGDPA